MHRDSPPQLHCPRTCLACPGWESHADTLWLVVLLSSFTSPVMIMLSLKFLKGDEPDATAAKH